MQSACLYLRSSKDRSDVSIDAQRRELQQLAHDRGFVVSAEFADVVVSANDDRPSFQDLLAALKRPDRGWDTILVLDTSRLARGVYFAQVFNHECEKHGVRVVYSKIPELDPLVKIVLMPVLQANDELHSYMSRVKGLAGMRENVLKGFRAGGRAPWGYRLKHSPTGAVRDGAPVTKSTLEPDPLTSAQAQAYLRARARGLTRSRAAAELGLRMPQTSLVGTDWQALTYAGHTVWNVHNVRVGGKHQTGRKRKPRAEWTVQRDTHPALITDAEAETILRMLETSTMSEAVSAAKGQASRYLLTGILKTADGRNWQGSLQRTRDGDPVGFYRVGSRLISAAPLEQAIVARVLDDIRSDRFVAALVDSARRQAGAQAEDPARALRLEQRRLAKDIDKTMEMAAGLADPAPALRRVDALEAQRKALTARIEEAERASTERQALASVTPEGVRAMLASIAEHAGQLNAPDLKKLLEVLVERVELDPDGTSASVCYSVDPSMTCASMAFPRGAARSAGRMLWKTRVSVRRRRRAA